MRVAVLVERSGERTGDFDEWEHHVKVLGVFSCIELAMAYATGLSVAGVEADKWSPWLNIAGQLQRDTDHGKGAQQWLDECEVES